MMYLFDDIWWQFRSWNIIWFRLRKGQSVGNVHIYTWHRGHEQTRTRQPLQTYFSTVGSTNSKGLKDWAIQPPSGGQSVDIYTWHRGHEQTRTHQKYLSRPSHTPTVGSTKGLKSKGVSNPSPSIDGGVCTINQTYDKQATNKRRDVCVLGLFWTSPWTPSGVAPHETGSTSKMVFLISAVLHPFNTINLWLEGSPDASGKDVLYLLTLFLAFGIWLVFNRYQKAVNSAVPFSLPVPEVSIFFLTRSDVRTDWLLARSGRLPQFSFIRYLQGERAITWR